LQTQWNISPSGVVVGLRYEAIPVALRMAGVEKCDRVRVMQALPVMEREALSIFGERHGK